MIEKKYIEALKACKPYLQNVDYVCIAIGEAAHHGGCMMWFSCQVTVDMIEQRIAPYRTVTEWLGRNHGIWPDSFEESREYRLRWVNSMIAEFEAVVAAELQKTS